MSYLISSQEILFNTNKRNIAALGKTNYRTVRSRRIKKVVNFFLTNKPFNTVCFSLSAIMFLKGFLP